MRTGGIEILQQKREEQGAFVTQTSLCSTFPSCFVRLACRGRLLIPFSSTYRLPHSQCVALTVCGSDRYASTVATPTSDRTCTRLTQCRSAQYIVTHATATSDRACAACGTCGEGEYGARACSAIRDTVCAPVSNCSERCIYDTQAGYCKARGTLTPCMAYEAEASCPRDRCLFVAGSSVPCRDPPASGAGQQPIPIGNRDCSLFVEAYCDGSCAWDAARAQCRVKDCPDYTVADECSAAGCVFESSVGFCRAQGTEVPCERYFTQALCQGEVGRCRFDVLTASCYAIGGHPRCDLFTQYGPELCPSADCEYDAAAPLCRDKHTVTPCPLYLSADACSVAGTEYQVRRADGRDRAKKKRFALNLAGKAIDACHSISLIVGLVALSLSLALLLFLAPPLSCSGTQCPLLCIRFPSLAGCNCFDLA